MQQGIPYTKSQKRKMVAQYRSGMSKTDIANKWNCSRFVVAAALRLFRCKSRSIRQSIRLASRRGKMHGPRLSGSQNPSWKGGVRVSSRGYRYIRDRTHPRSLDGYVPEHVVVAERVIGRPLRDDEVVHHLNEVKTDNRPENLMVMTIRAHRSLHAKEQWSAAKSSGQKTLKQPKETK